MYQRALQGYKKALGPDHISTLYTVGNLAILYYNRFYNAVKRSAFENLPFCPSLAPRTNPTADIVKFVDLCIRYPPRRTDLLHNLCKMLLWIDEDALAFLAFSYQVADSIPSYNAFCDGCRCGLEVATCRFACKSCKDIDLCRSCFERYEMDELKHMMLNCQDHPFLELSKIGEIGSPIYAGRTIDTWLQELRSSLSLM
jgi:hypothetical protein